MGSSEFVIRRPDDWHLHLRDGDLLRAVIGFSAADFARAVVMPNLDEPVATSASARAYLNRIREAMPAGADFEPLMTLYLTQNCDADDLKAGAQSGLIRAVKLYPAGATTNAHAGVRDVDALTPIFETMAAIDLPLLVHGEATDDDIDVFDREAVFIDRILDPLRRRIPELRIVFEHVTTADAVAYVNAADGAMAATITVHHLILNRNAYLAGGIRPHYYCLPVAKRERHRQALRQAAMAGEGRFFLGTDSAPHRDADKLSPCGCAGIFTAAGALSCLAHCFEEEGRLDRLEAFVSLNGPRFYRMPVNRTRTRFFKEDRPLSPPRRIPVGDDGVTLFDPGFPLFWRHERLDAPQTS